MSNDRKKEISLSFEGIENDLARWKLCARLLLSLKTTHFLDIELKDKLDEEDIDLQTKTCQILIERSW